MTGLDLSQIMAKANERLNKIDSRIAERMRNVITIAHSMGIYVIITQGLRTIAEQNALYAQGRTKPGKVVTNAKGGYSFHNFGLAVDFAIVDSTGKTVYWDTNADTNKDGQKDWYQVGKIGKDQGLEWGGDWTSFKDIPHFQYTFGLTTAQLRAGKRPSSTQQIPGGKPIDGLSLGSSGAKVKDLQEKLNFLEINVGKADGIYGNDTVNGVKLLQSRKGLPVTGVANKATVDLLDALYAERKGETTIASPDTKPTDNKESEKEGAVRMYKPSAQDMINATSIVLNRLSGEVHGELAISKVHREKLMKGELSLDDAIGLIYTALARGLIQGEGKKSE